MDALSWLVAAALPAFLVVRCLRQPDQPALKWLLPVGALMLSAGAVLVNLWLVVPGAVLLVVVGYWDRLWREAEGQSTFF